jgi:hypothetical protein
MGLAFWAAGQSRKLMPAGIDVGGPNGGETTPTPRLNQITLSYALLHGSLKPG